MLPDDPMPVIFASVRAALTGVTVAGERPTPLVPTLPCVVLSRVGGTELESYQDAVADQPLISADCYADGDDALPDAFALAQRARVALRALGARPSTGPIETPDAEEDEGVRRVTFTSRLTTR